MDQEDAARMATRKNRAIELVEQRAIELGLAPLKEVVWEPKWRDLKWSFRVAWQGGHRTFRIDQDLLIDEGEEARFAEEILGWFNEEVAPLCPKLDDDAELKIAS